MQPSPARAINLSFSNAVTVLMIACEVPPSGRSAFEARIRLLQRSGVPVRTPDQRMSRIDYGIAELAALATAFKLMAAFMTPALAARYVTERWQQLAPFALAGARDAFPPDYLFRRPISTGSIAVFEGNALADMGQKERHDPRYAGELGNVTVTNAACLAPLANKVGVFIDSSTFMPAIVTHAVEVAMATDAELATELDMLRFSNLVS